MQRVFRHLDKEVSTLRVRQSASAVALLGRAALYTATRKKKKSAPPSVRELSDPHLTGGLPLPRGGLFSAQLLVEQVM